MGESFGEAFSNIGGILDADTLCAHGFGDLGEVRVLEVDAKGDHAGLLHLDIYEIKGIVVEDDLNDWSIALLLGQQVAQREHGEASVAANSDGLAAGIRQLRTEGVGRGVGHGGPGKGAKQAAISAAHEVPG